MRAATKSAANPEAPISSAAGFRALVEYSSDVITVLAADGLVLFNTPAVLRVLGYEPAELFGRRAFDFVHPDDVTAVVDSFGLALAQPGVAVPVTFRFRHRDGHWVPLEAIGSNRLDDPNVHGIVVNSRDITEHRRVEESLRASYRDKAELLEIAREEAAISTALMRVGRELIAALNLPNLLERLCEITARVLECECSHTILFDAQERDYYLAAQYGSPPQLVAAIEGLRVPEWAGESIIDRLHGDDVTRLDPDVDVTAARLTEAFGVTGLVYLALRRGDEIIGMQSASYLSGAGTFSPVQERIGRGIAQLASLAMEHSRVVSELERANRLKSEFVATMSHELRTPLNIILGYHSLLLDGTFGAMADEQRDTVERADRNARSLLELISATLDMSRLQSGRLPLDLAQFHLRTLLDEVDAETRELARKPGVRLIWDPHPALPWLYSDAAKVKVVLRNLIGNAVKFTDAGTITIRAESARDGVEIAVHDTGSGIAEEHLAAIFEPFRQASGSQRGGVGLGLYIVRRLLEELGGSVEVTSIVGRGSTFRVWVPLRAAHVRSRDPLE